MKKENWKGESEGTPSKFSFCFGLKTSDCFFVEPFDNFHGEFYRIFVIFQCADSMMTVDITDRNANHDGWDTVAGSMDVFSVCTAAAADRFLHWNTEFFPKIQSKPLETRICDH